MALKINKVFNLKGIIILVLSTISLIASTNIDCVGKPFHCINSTHFMICVDLGGGISRTIDNFVIPCPPTTVCQGINRFECEFAPTMTVISYTNDPQTVEVSATNSLLDVITTTEIPRLTNGILNEEHFNTQHIMDTTATASEHDAVHLTTRQPEEIFKNNFGIREINKFKPVSTPSESRLEISTTSADYIANYVNMSKEPLNLFSKKNSEIIAITNNTAHSELVSSIDATITTEAISTTSDIIKTDADVYSFPNIISSVHSTFKSGMLINKTNYNETKSEVMISTETVFYDNFHITTELPVNETSYNEPLSIKTNQFTKKVDGNDMFTMTENYNDTITTNSSSGSRIGIDANFETLSRKSEFITNDAIIESGLGLTVNNSEFTASSVNINNYETETEHTSQPYYETIPETLNPFTIAEKNKLDFTNILSYPNKTTTNFDQITVVNKAITTTDAILPLIVQNINGFTNDEITPSNFTEGADVMVTTESYILNDTSTINNIIADHTTGSLELINMTPRKKTLTGLATTEVKTFTDTSFTFIQNTTEPMSTTESPIIDLTHVNITSNIINSEAPENEFTTSPTNTNKAFTDTLQALYLSSSDNISKASNHFDVPERFISTSTEGLSDATTESVLISNEHTETNTTPQYQLQNSSSNINDIIKTNNISESILRNSEHPTEVIINSTKKYLNKQDNGAPSLELPDTVTVQYNPAKNVMPHPTTNKQASILIDNLIKTTMSYSETQLREVNLLESSILKNELKKRVNISLQPGKQSDLMTTVETPIVKDPMLSALTTTESQVLLNSSIDSATETVKEKNVVDNIPTTLLNSDSVREFKLSYSKYPSKVVTDSTKIDLSKQDNGPPSLELSKSILNDMITETPIGQGKNIFSSKIIDKATTDNSNGQIDKANPLIFTVQDNTEKSVMPPRTNDKQTSIIIDNLISTTVSYSETPSHEINLLESSLVKNELKRIENILVQPGKLSDLVMTTDIAPKVIDSTYLSTLSPNGSRVLLHNFFNTTTKTFIKNVENNVPTTLYEWKDPKALTDSQQIDTVIDNKTTNSMNENFEKKSMRRPGHEENLLKLSNSSLVNNSGIITGKSLNRSSLDPHLNLNNAYSTPSQRIETIIPTPNVDVISPTMSILIYKIKNQNRKDNTLNYTTPPKKYNTSQIDNTNVGPEVPSTNNFNLESGTLNKPSTTTIVASQPILNIENHSLISPITELVMARSIGKITKNSEQMNAQTERNQSQYLLKEDSRADSLSTVSSLSKETIDQQKTSNLVFSTDRADAPITNLHYNKWMTKNPLDVAEEILRPANSAISQSDHDPASIRKSNLNMNIATTSAVILNEETSYSHLLSSALDLSVTTESYISKLEEPSHIIYTPNLVTNDTHKNTSLNKDRTLLTNSESKSDIQNVSDMQFNSQKRNDTALRNIPLEKYVLDSSRSHVSKQKLEINVTEIEIRENHSKTFNSTNIDFHKTANPVNICKNCNRGRYADKEDCRKFYICIGKLHPIVGMCPINTVFSEIRKQCTRNLSHCIRNNQFVCTSEGRYWDFLQDNVYYICVRNSSADDHYIRFKLQCQNGFSLDQTSIKCVPKSTESNQSSSLNTSNTNSYSSSSQSVTERLQKKTPRNKFNCETEGKFADPNDCRKYYICYKNSKSILKQKKKECDSDEVFDKDTKICKDTESYEC